MSITNSPPKTTTGGRAGRHTLSIRSNVRFGCIAHMFKTCSLESLNSITVVFFFLLLSLLTLVWVAESLYCSLYAVHGWCHFPNYVDNYPFAYMLMSVSPGHSMGNLEGTTMSLLFRHLHKGKQTMTARIVWKTSENHRMPVWHNYS